MPGSGKGFKDRRGRKGDVVGLEEGDEGFVVVGVDVFPGVARGVVGGGEVAVGGAPAICQLGGGWRGGGGRREGDGGFEGGGYGRTPGD